MNYKINKNIVSSLAIVAGLVIFFIAAGNFILRIVGALFALSLINWGLTARGLPSLNITLRSWLEVLRIF